MLAPEPHWLPVAATDNGGLSLRDSLIVAGVGVLGVVVGSLATAFSTWLAERRRARRDRMAASRLVLTELKVHELFVRRLKRRLLKGYMGPTDWTALPLSLDAHQWKSQQGVLAPTLDEVEWDRVERAYTALADDWQDFLLSRSWDDWAEEDSAQTLGFLAEALERGVTALGRHAQLPTMLEHHEISRLTFIEEENKWAWEAEQLAAEDADAQDPEKP